MQKLISYPLSFIVLILILLTLVVFHPIQWICLHVFGYQAHKKMADYIEKHKRSAVIFPEGTRSRDGVPKEFAQTGLKILCKNATSAHIVPISINNSWKLLKYGTFPYGLGNHITFVAHESFAV